MRRPLPVKANVVASGQRARSDPAARLPFALFVSPDRTRCMLGSGQFGRCNLPAISADAPSASPTLIKHSNAVARTGRSGMDRSFAHAEVPSCALWATTAFRSGS